MQNLQGRDLLTLGELTPGELRDVLDRAVAQKQARKMSQKPPTPTGKAAALIFMKPSLRTRVSFEVACVDLGMHPVVLGPGDAFSDRKSVV